MSTAPHMTFGHALVRNLVDSRVGLTDFTDQLQISFHTMNEDAQDPEVQQEIAAYHELCALREGLYRATATPLATAKLIGILELPAPHPSGNEANDARARYQHATLILRTIDKLERRTRPSSRATRETSSEESPTHADTPRHTETRVPPLPSERTETRVPPVPSERGGTEEELVRYASTPAEAEETRAPALPTERGGSEEELVPSVSGGTAHESSVHSDPDEIHLNHHTITTSTDTPPTTPSLARAG